jgi:hypothetical protein
MPLRILFLCYKQIVCANMKFTEKIQICTKAVGLVRTNRK